MKLALVLLLVPSASAAALTARRAFLKGAGAVAAATSLSSAPAFAAQRGAENAYANQLFDDTMTCVKRNPLGACQDFAAAPSEAAAAPMQLSQRPAAADPASDSEVVKRLLQRTADNAEKNAREVKEKTIKSNLGATYGPFAKNAPVMLQTGDFMDLPLARYDRLKDQKKIVTNKNGLDVFIPGFDPTAPEPKQKLFGVF